MLNLLTQWRIRWTGGMTLPIWDVDTDFCWKHKFSQVFGWI